MLLLLFGSFATVWKGLRLKDHIDFVLEIVYIWHSLERVVVLTIVLVVCGCLLSSGEAVWLRIGPIIKFDNRPSCTKLCFDCLWDCWIRYDYTSCGRCNCCETHIIRYHHLVRIVLNKSILLLHWINVLNFSSVVFLECLLHQSRRMSDVLSWLLSDFDVEICEDRYCVLNCKRHINVNKIII